MRWSDLLRSRHPFATCKPSMNTHSQHMIYTCFAFCVFSLSLVHPTLAQSYHIQDIFLGENFFDNWKWETMDDPTHGRVNYVDKSTAMRSNLSYASGDKFVMRADSTKLVPPGSRGRDSVRITSKKANGDSLIMLDLTHMPEGCGTWPAWWTLSQAGPWPNGGEIDIIEGVNQNTQNLASLHTTPDCTMPPERFQGGKAVSGDCDVAVNNNQGCGTSFNKPNSYGAGFNANGGGWYIMERSRAKGINVWFWPRDDPALPSEVRGRNNIITPNPSWGPPDATFPTDSCDYDSHFDAHQMIFDLTFCGDWAGSAFPASGCGSTACDDFVNNNPRMFENAYWEINSLCVYTPSNW